MVRALASIDNYCSEVLDEDWDVNEARYPLLGAGEDCIASSQLQGCFTGI